MNRCSSSTRPSASNARTSVPLPLTYRPPSTLSLMARIVSALYAPMISEFCQISPFFSVLDTTYLGESFIKGAPGSSAAVRLDQAGANIPDVPRPGGIPLHDPLACAVASPTFGTKGESNPKLRSSQN